MTSTATHAPSGEIAGLPRRWTFQRSSTFSGRAIASHFSSQIDRRTARCLSCDEHRIYASAASFLETEIAKLIRRDTCPFRAAEDREFDPLSNKISPQYAATGSAQQLHRDLSQQSQSDDRNRVAERDASSADSMQANRAYGPECSFVERDLGASMRGTGSATVSTVQAARAASDATAAIR